MTAPPVIWTPAPGRAAASELAQFQRFCEAHTGHGFPNWLAFHQWSVTEFRQFWALFLEWTAVRHNGDASAVCVGDGVEDATFFPDVRLSFTEHLLSGGGVPDEAIAIVECHEDRAPREILRGTLRRRVAATARALVALGVREGDRVVGYAAHDADTAIVALAALGLGATWSACGPELAPDAVEARFSSLAPTVLFATRSIFQDGTRTDLLPRACRVAASLPTLRATILAGEQATGAPGGALAWSHPMHDFEALLGAHDDVPFEWARFAFNHPLYILFSSGTTGPPKAIVHGAGGTLLEHLKEHRLHGDLGPTDRLYFQTSCGWMMWQWTLSALATGASIVTYDGSVSAPGPDALWRLAASTRTTMLGASPAFVQYCRDAEVTPRAHNLRSLRAFLSTGSVLEEHHFDWIACNVPPLQIQSISGGTDIIGCFVLGNPTLPVWRGESQCVGLAMDVRAEVDPAGGPAELVCGRPFPSRPVGFLGDPDRRLFHEAYFAARPGLWTHGDFIELTPRGSAHVLGRSYGVLKVRGVRIGPGEITSVVQEMPEVREAMAVEQRAPHEPGGSRIVLLVVLAEGVVLDRALTHRIKRAVRDRRSADHVPALIIPIPELPVTVNGKRSERAARDAVDGKPSANRAALRNPEVLDRLLTSADLRVD